ncbi:MAG: helix-turn-helix transcriptional regulator [Rhizobiaceae bacterium]
MQRTDRLFEIISMLRAASKPLTARDIANRLEVTPRTVYRHMATLQSMRIPIEGEAGVGYIMRPGYDLPPLNFDIEEREAIMVGLCMLKRTGDHKLQTAADRVFNKIGDTWSEPLALQVSDWGIEQPEGPVFQTIRDSVRSSQKLKIEYFSKDEINTVRTILPLVLTYHVEYAVLGGWCELREDFRHFRVDKILKLDLLEEFFPDSARNLRLELEAVSDAS